MPNTYVVDVKAFNRTASLTSTEQFYFWTEGATPPGPIRSLHNVDIPFDNVNGTHVALKTLLHKHFLPYYYQPQAQLRDREIVTAKNRGAIIVNVPDEILKQWLTVELLAIISEHDKQNKYEVRLNGQVGDIVECTAELTLVHRIRMPILEKVDATQELMAKAQRDIDSENRAMDEGSMASKHYAPMAPPVSPTYSSTSSSSRSCSPSTSIIRVPSPVHSTRKRPVEDELEEVKVHLKSLTQTVTTLLNQQAEMLKVLRPM